MKIPKIKLTKKGAKEIDKIISKASTLEEACKALVKRWSKMIKKKKK